MIDEDLLAEVAKSLAAKFLTGQAVGIMMEREDLDPDGALAALELRAAQREMTVLEAATWVIYNRRVGRSTARPTSQAVAQQSVIPGAHDLSSREYQVLRLVACGATNNDIAAELYLTVNTVKTYIRTAYRKIGVTRRSQAVLWAVQNGVGGIG